MTEFSGQATGTGLENAEVVMGNGDIDFKYLKG